VRPYRQMQGGGLVTGGEGWSGARAWRVWAYLVAGPREEAVTALLWEAGTLGIETREEKDGRVRVEGWFGGEVAADPLAGRAGEGVEALGGRRVEEADWLAVYRDKARPFALGRRFWVDPREPGEAGDAPEGRILLRLPARTAFGIGSHESTRLAVELLEEAAVAGRRVLDVGTGTGILAFAALALGAASAVAFDVDTGAMAQARANATLNGCEPTLFAGVTESLRPTARFDLALVNIIPEVIVPELPDIARLLGGRSGEAAGRAGGGEMILSGILAERGDWVLAAAAAAGFAERARRQAGEWIAFRVGREGGR
jgi:ribosomal protein L11 methyltransferase